MMNQDSGLLFWGVVLVAMVVFMFLPQWTARRRQKKREEALTVGDRIVTIGGLIGDLTYLDFDADAARVRLAEGMEIDILARGIRGKYEAAVEDAVGVADAEEASQEETGEPDGDE